MDSYWFCTFTPGICRYQECKILWVEDPIWNFGNKRGISEIQNGRYVLVKISSIILWFLLMQWFLSWIYQRTHGNYVACHNVAVPQGGILPCLHAVIMASWRYCCEKLHKWGISLERECKLYSLSADHCTTSYTNGV